MISLGREVKLPKADNPAEPGRSFDLNNLSISINHTGYAVEYMYSQSRPTFVQFSNRVLE